MAKASAVNNSASIVTGRVLGSLVRLGTKYTLVAVDASVRIARDVAHGAKEGHRGAVIRK